jgi:8-oxo-dGTP pyrophosphatase MutT (NUDIX family)
MVGILGLFFMSLFATNAYEGAGIQLFKGEKVLMVQGARSGRWGFPKGHREDFDADWRATAVREIREETGFEEGVNFVVCSEESSHWGSRIYWTAQLLQDREPVVNTTEHRAVRWVSRKKLDEMRVTQDVDEWMLNGMPTAC